MTADYGYLRSVEMLNCWACPCITDSSAAAAAAAVATAAYDTVYIDGVWVALYWWTNNRRRIKSPLATPIVGNFSLQTSEVQQRWRRSPMLTTRQHSTWLHSSMFLRTFSDASARETDYRSSRRSWRSSTAPSSQLGWSATSARESWSGDVPTCILLPTSTSAVLLFLIFSHYYSVSSI